MTPFKQSTELAPRAAFSGVRGTQAQIRESTTGAALDDGAGDVSASPVSLYDSTDFFRNRGISRETCEARGYLGYGRDDPASIETAKKLFEGLTAQQRATMTRKMRSGRYVDEDHTIRTCEGGFLIPRTPPRGLDLPHIYPELRPDKPLITRQYEHLEDPDRKLDADLVPVRVLKGKSAQAHIDSPKHHDGIAPDGINEYLRTAKYNMVPRRKVKEHWRHNHADMKSESLARHLGSAKRQKQHEGQDLERSHSHYDLVPDRSEPDHAWKRLDVNPRVYDEFGLDAFRDAEIVFFNIEGCPKADATLDNICKLGIKAAVFSVLAVGFWYTDCFNDLRLFAAELRGKPIIIVPDGDWFTNWQVYNQALMCREYLRRLGLDAHVAAPPNEWVEGEKKGVDDFLGEGRSLDELVLLDVEVRNDIPLLVRQELYRRGIRIRADRVRNEAATIMTLALLADENGTVSKPLSSLGKIIGISPRAVQNRMQSVLDTGLITADRPLATKPNYYAPRRYDGTRHEEWDDQPVFTIHESLRAVTGPRMTLGQKHPDIFGDRPGVYASKNVYYVSFTEAKVTEAKKRRAVKALHVAVLKQMGLSFREIEKETGIRRETAHRYYQKWDKEGKSSPMKEVVRMLLEQVKQAAYEGSYKAFRDAALDVETEKVIREEGHPADATVYAIARAEEEAA
jgi:hypothetical protein